jgi:hypothetical protein
MSGPATTLTASPSIADVLQDIRTFLQAILGTGTQVIRGIANRVPAPLPQTGFIVLTPIYQERLEYNADNFSDVKNPAPTTLSIRVSMRIDVQCDVYGSGGWAGTWAAMIVQLWRDEFACNAMVNSQPLYADDARMIPLTDSEQQYEERWSMTLTAQYNPVVTPAQTFADGTDFGMIPADLPVL